MNPAEHQTRLEDAFLSRRQILGRCGMGMGAVALSQLMGQANMLQAQSATQAMSLNPLAVKSPPFVATAKRVIHLFAMAARRTSTRSIPSPAGQIRRQVSIAKPRDRAENRRRFPRRSSSTDMARAASRSASFFRENGESIDDICVIRSMQADVPNHEPSLMLMNCGEARLVRPASDRGSPTAWEAKTKTCPGFIAMCPGGYPIQESQNWQSGFLPGVYQGTYIDSSNTDIEKLIENIRNSYVSQ